MILFLGTTSGAGKTVMTAMFCRHLLRKGVDVVPFKASNLSSDSYVTADGGEIGIGQALQALACGVPPETDMNPVLLKPVDGRIRLILNGFPQDRPVGQDTLLSESLKAYDRLLDGHEAVVAEGSGSPAELNLRGTDIANIGLVRNRDVDCVLIGDIDKGGVFAGIYGTWLLFPEDVRDRLKGFIINRFRGDPSILRDGIERIEKMTGMRCAGVMPMTALRLPEEDSLNGTSGGITERECLDGLDDLTDLAEKVLDMEWLENLV